MNLKISNWQNWKKKAKNELLVSEKLNQVLSETYLYHQYMLQQVLIKQ